MTDDFNPDYVSEHLAPGVPRTDRFGRRVRTMAETKLARIEAGTDETAKLAQPAGREPDKLQTQSSTPDNKDKQDG